MTLQKTLENLNESLGKLNNLNATTWKNDGVIKVMLDKYLFLENFIDCFEPEEFGGSSILFKTHFKNIEVQTLVLKMNVKEVFKDVLYLLGYRKITAEEFKIGQSIVTAHKPNGERLEFLENTHVMTDILPEFDYDEIMRCNEDGKWHIEEVR
ncbi:MAG: hypothetical protein ACOCQD_02305 [archaeon]